MTGSQTSNDSYAKNIFFRTAARLEIVLLLIWYNCLSVGLNRSAGISDNDFRFPWPGAYFLKLKFSISQTKVILVFEKISPQMTYVKDLWVSFSILPSICFSWCLLKQVHILKEMNFPLCLINSFLEGISGRLINIDLWCCQFIMCQKQEMVSWILLKWNYLCD